MVENGQEVAAIALLNSHSTVAGSLVDTAQGPLRTSYLSANVSANATVDFLSPLGLLPTDLTVPSSWTSTSAFTAEGAYIIGYFYHYVGPKETVSIGPTSVLGEVERSGNVTVVGSVSSEPGSAVNFGGVSFLNVSLDVEGPFVAREGFILVPDDVDLFGTSSVSPLSGNETAGAGTAQMTSLYVRPGPGSHFGIGGSEWLYSASALNPSVTSLTPAAPVGGGVAEIAAGWRTSAPLRSRGSRSPSTRLRRTRAAY